MIASLLIKTRLLSMVSVFLVLFIACQNSITPPQWHWERAEIGLPRQAIVLTVVANPLDPKQLWAGYYDSGGLTSSFDGGQTWTIGAAGLGDNPIFDLLPVVDDSGTGVVLWAATRDGLLQSSDAGATWQAAIGNLPAVTAFALATDSTGRLYVGLDGAGIYTQVGNGQEWEAVVAPTEPLASAAVLSLAVSPNGKQLYAGTSGQGVFASRDGGKRWIRTYPGQYAPTLAFNPNNPALAVASLRNRLVRSRDGGESWHTIPLPWVEYNEIVSFLWLADGLLGAGTSQGRIYYSLDDGQTWVEGGAGLPPGGVLALSMVGNGATATDPHQLLAGTWTGVYGSRDGGQTWANLAPSLGTPNGQALLAIDGGLLLGTRSGLFRWQPGARQWTPMSSQFPSGVSSLAADPVDNHVLYAGTSNSALYRSQDAGANWEPMPALVSGIPALAVDPKDRNHIYLLAAWERVYESRDGGQSWEARWDGLGKVLETISLVVDPLEHTTYVGTETGLFRSDRNDNWILVAEQLADQSILALLVQTVPNLMWSDSILYIGTTRGAYRSVNGGVTIEGNGQTWGNGLENLSVTAFLADDQIFDHLYAGTAYGGVYQSVDGGRNWHPIGPPELDDDIIKGMAWGSNGELFVVAGKSIWRGQRNNEQ